jgi:transcriptional regulator with XRE-family HTH domain
MIFCGMTPQEMIAFRARMGWDRTELARRLEISVSRLTDYELGHTRGKKQQKAPIPRLVELACAWLGEHEGKNRALTPAERAALWRDTSYLTAIDAVVDDSRDALYDPPRGL